MKRHKDPAPCVTRPRWSFTFRRHDTDALPCTSSGSPIYSHEVSSYAADDQFSDALASARASVAKRAGLRPGDLYCVGAAAENLVASGLCEHYREHRRKP